MKINLYEFGRIEIDGNTYRNDVIILPDCVMDNWWRKEGHRLDIDDVKDIIKEKPEILIIGTGASGAMRVPDETMEFIKARGIKLIIDKTDVACRIYNKISRHKRVIAALHLTC